MLFRSVSRPMSRSLRRSARLSNSRRVRWVSTHSEIYDLILAVNEVATNIVVHGYRGQPGAIEIELRRQGDAIEIRLRDQAPLFDPTRCAGAGSDIAAAQAAAWRHGRPCHTARSWMPCATA